MEESRWFVVRVKYLKDGTYKKSELMDYPTWNQAVAKFHQNLATDMVDDTLRGSMCVVLNEYGAVDQQAYWGDIEQSVAE